MCNHLIDLKGLPHFFPHLTSIRANQRFTSTIGPTSTVHTPADTGTGKFSYCWAKFRDTMIELIMETQPQDGVIIFSIVFVLLFVLTIFELVIDTKKFICYIIVVTILTFVFVRVSVKYQLLFSHRNSFI